ncbi:MAG: hypothetical protein ACD_7C00348G0004 [uncultured bacterium]|nr:MAG: hypothetical protein ACD_7C00348G0004 [uncultured bacterium]HBR79956.1 hypothetical protein [Candidatus Moranbacteria bacterium]
MLNLTKRAKIVFLVGLFLALGVSVAWAAYAPGVVFEGSETSATSATFTSDASYSSVRVAAHVSAGTVITKQGGGFFDFSNFSLVDIGEAGPSDFVGGFEFGISGVRLSSNNPINFQVNVDSSWNGRTLSIYLQRAGERGWRKVAVGDVSSGVITFSSTGLGKFVISDYGKSRFETESGGKYDKYEEYKEKYGSNETYRKWFFRINWYKKNDFPLYFKIKTAYHIYNQHKGELAYEAYKNDYENYRRYVKYNTYKELRKYRNY